MHAQLGTRPSSQTTPDAARPWKASGDINRATSPDFVAMRP
jgi:hypothetical protein